MYDFSVLCIVVVDKGAGVMLLEQGLALQLDHVVGSVGPVASVAALGFWWPSLWPAWPVWGLLRPLVVPLTSLRF